MRFKAVLSCCIRQCDSSIKLCRARSRECGAALLEAAIVIPFILIVLFGVYQVGWMSWAYLIASDTAGAGARHLVSLGSQIEEGCWDDFAGLHKQGTPPGKIGALNQWLAQNITASLLKQIYSKDLPFYHYDGDGSKVLGPLISSMYIKDANSIYTKACGLGAEEFMAGVKVEGYLKLPLLPISVRISAKEQAPFLLSMEPKSVYPASDEPASTWAALDSCGGISGSKGTFDKCIETGTGLGSSSDGEHVYDGDPDDPNPPVV
ncbi:pilus assembly protein [Oligoflexia bacterium]|nr:pilus assembly protein [Oligoflexia bacterium]